MGSTQNHIDPRARQIADCVRRIDQLSIERAHAVEMAAVPFDEKIAIEQKALDALLGPTSRARQFELARERTVVRIDGRRRKPKKRWKQAALYIQTHPGVEYPELCKHLYGVVNDQKLKTLRGMLYRLREAGAVIGDPGAWRLLKTPDEIEWLKDEEDDTQIEENVQ